MTRRPVPLVSPGQIKRPAQARESRRRATRRPAGRAIITAPSTLPLVLLVALAGLAPAPSAPAPAERQAYDWIVAEACWRAPDGRVLAFRVLGRAGEERGRTVGVYEACPEGWRELFLDSDRGFAPWCLQLAELDGDELPEVAVGTFKTTRFDPVPRRRVFVYDWTGEALFAKWLGSRLGLELEEFAFAPGGDGTSRLLSVESAGRDGLVLRQYRWAGFGFRRERDWQRRERPADWPRARGELVDMMRQMSGRSAE